MFGSKKIQELESTVSELKRAQDKIAKERDDLKKDLDSARRKISDLEKSASDLKEQLAATESEQLKAQLGASIAEYEGLKDLYTRKNQEFDDDKAEKEQAFARHAAVERFNLENEIQENRRSNEEYVSASVKSFTESYNYYLNQIRLLMDALGDVASRAGEELFSGSNDDLKARIGQQMADKLKEETDPLRSDNGDLILIGAEAHIEEPAEAEEIEEIEEPEEAEEIEEAEEAEEIEEVEEAAEEAFEAEKAEEIEEAEEAAEEAEEIEAAEEIEEAEELEENKEAEEAVEEIEAAEEPEEAKEEIPAE